MKHQGADRLKGMMTALVTPFKNGRLDYKAFDNLVEWQIDCGIAGLVPVGTTGESPTLSHDEHRAVVERCVKIARGRVPVIAGAGSNNTNEAVDLARHGEKSGADALLVVAPYYNRPTQEGIYAHYKAINDAVGIPIVIYNIPPRSVVDVSIATMAKLYELPNIVGVKDSTGNIGRVSLQRAAMGNEFIQFTGEDLFSLAAVAAGSQGCISVTSNIAPAQCAQVVDLGLAGEFSQALHIHDRLVPLHEAVFLEPGVAGAKFGLSLLGKLSPEIRLPLQPVNATTAERIRSAMVRAGLIVER